MLKYAFLAGALIVIIIGLTLLFRSGQQFGVGIDIIPIPDPIPPVNPDQALYDTIKNAELAGTVPQFTITDTSDISKITAQYVQLAKDNGITGTSTEKNLYVATRAALQAQGMNVQPIAEPLP